MSTLLLAAGTATGALAGFAAGVLWTAVRLPDLSPVAAGAIVAVAVAADVEHLRTGRLRPLAVRTQVPQLWGRLLDAPTVAVLYGARLGVGPLTRLATWLWWAATLLAASAGPWVAAGAGATFMVARTLTMGLAVPSGGDGDAMSRRMVGVRRVERRAALVCTAAATLAALTLTVACSVGGGGADVSSRQGDERADGGDRDEHGRAADDARTAGDHRTGGDRAGDDGDATGTDVGSGDGASATSSAGPPTADPLPGDAVLADLLLSDAALTEALPGYERADDALGAGPLDLDAAARAEGDVDAERAVLETRGFRTGHSRAWRSPGGDVAVAVVYELADAESARLYLLDGRDALTGRAATPFDVPDVPGAIGFSQVDETPHGAFTGHAVAFTRGPRWFLVVAGGSSSGPSVDDARALAAAQAAQAVGGARAGRAGD